uniref:Uncharacterized protein n=1 Tax=Cajanus cajan TaxID=3821 RepID=A0A151U4K4_CAJCA|nr:hypothetical protein KK1_006896 [Cajanus cajan]
MKFHRTDAQSILSQIKRQEKQIKLKRRWYFKNRHLSESLLREDDIFYESVRAHVEDTFGAHHIEQDNHVLQDDMDLIRMLNMKGFISWCHDNLNTKGLYLLAMIVTGGSFKSQLTRCKLKRVIKGSLSSIVGSKSHNRLETRKHIFSLRTTLIAMLRKIKGVRAPVPRLQSNKHGCARDHLMKLVKKVRWKMLPTLDRVNELEEPLAKATAVADLSLKLATGCQNIFPKEFYQFRFPLKSLRSDIMNATWSVKKSSERPELRNLQLLIEPETAISNRCLQSAFVNLLIEFLFECSDMDSVPKFLSQILDVINRGSNSNMHNVLFKKYINEEEVDCILNMSALTKQIVSDLLPDVEFDKDFTDAYLEQPDESDDSGSDEHDDDDSQLQEHIQFSNGTFGSMDSFYEVESMFYACGFHPSSIMTEENVSSSSLTTSDSLNNYYTVNLESQVHNTPHNQCQEESTEHLSTFIAGKNNNSSVLSPERE